MNPHLSTHFHIGNNSKANFSVRISLQELKGCCVEGIVTRTTNVSSKIETSNNYGLSKEIT
jgi:hypothetical protein